MHIREKITKNRQRFWIVLFLKEDIQMATRHTETTCSPSLIISKCEAQKQNIIHNHQRGYYQKENTHWLASDVEEKKFPALLVGMQIRSSHYGKQYGCFPKIKNSLIHKSALLGIYLKQNLNLKKNMYKLSVSIAALFTIAVKIQQLAN